jgi:hypothetical protein
MFEKPQSSAGRDGLHCKAVKSCFLARLDDPLTRPAPALRDGKNAGRGPPSPKALAVGHT